MIKTLIFLNSNVIIIVNIDIGKRAGKPYRIPSFKFTFIKIYWIHLDFIMKLESIQNTPRITCSNCYIPAQPLGASMLCVALGRKKILAYWNGNLNLLFIYYYNRCSNDGLRAKNIWLHVKYGLGATAVEINQINLSR